MLHAPRHQSRSYHADGVAMNVLAGDRHSFKTLCWHGDIRNGQASLIAHLRLIANSLPHRIDDGTAHAGLNAGAVIDKDALEQTNLISRKAYSSGIIHGFEHVFGELF